jgi:hypothetical protein
MDHRGAPGGDPGESMEGHQMGKLVDIVWYRMKVL